MPEFKADDFTRIATLYAPEIVSSLAISPTGSLLAIVAGDKVHVHQFKVLSSSTVDCPRLVTLFMPDKVQSVIFTPDGKQIVVAIANKVHLYSVPAEA